jgi:Na+/H+-dicarboxylate symporter
MSALERFMGGSIVGTLLKLIVISIAVGLVLAWLNLTPWDVIDNLRRSLDHLLARSTSIVHDLVSYVLVGAVIVIPVWIVIRLLKSAPSGKR